QCGVQLGHTGTDARFDQRGDLAGELVKAALDLARTGAQAMDFRFGFAHAPVEIGDDISLAGVFGGVETRFDAVDAIKYRLEIQHVGLSGDTAGRAPLSPQNGGGNPPGGPGPPASSVEL